MRHFNWKRIFTSWKLKVKGEIPQLVWSSRNSLLEKKNYLLNTILQKNVTMNCRSLNIAFFSSISVDLSWSLNCRNFCSSLTAIHALMSNDGDLLFALFSMLHLNFGAAASDDNCSTCTNSLPSWILILLIWIIRCIPAL